MKQTMAPPRDEWDIPSDLESADSKALLSLLVASARRNDDAHRELKINIDAMRALIHGNGHRGLVSRMVAIETRLLVVWGILGAVGAGVLALALARVSSAP